MKIARIESFLLGTGSSKDLLSTPRVRDIADLKDASAPPCPISLPGV